MTAACDQPGDRRHRLAFRESEIRGEDEWGNDE